MKYKVGDSVVHKLFGAGVILASYTSHSGADVVEVKFDRLETNRNILADTKAMKNKTVPIINMEDKK